MNHKPTREHVSDANSISAATLERMDNDIATIGELLKSSSGYQVTFTLRLDNGKLSHHQLTNNFPPAEMLRCHKNCRDLIVELLEEQAS